MREFITNGETIACETECDNVVCPGPSDWGAYGLARGVAMLAELDAWPDANKGEREEKRE